MSDPSVDLSVYCQSNTEDEAIYLFPDDFFAFQGHFPSHPILPGFITIGVVEHALGLMTKKSIRLDLVKKAKFKKSILPNDVVLVKIISQKWDRDRMTARIHVSTDGDLAADLSLSLLNSLV
ncbi:MAG: hypothetical protein HQL32_03180 [Planctomycetes bacterium]|nr:hypothetical protein [Planctomycetota bacterium]